RKAGTPGTNGPPRAEVRSLRPTVDSPRLRFRYTGTMGARLAYEDELHASLDAMLREAGDYFAMGGRLHETVRRLASRLEAGGITYALLGAMALGRHGYVRMTDDVDVLLTPQGLERFREQLVGRAYIATQPGPTAPLRAT